MSFVEGDESKYLNAATKIANLSDKLTSSILIGLDAYEKFAKNKSINSCFKRYSDSIVGLEIAQGIKQEKPVPFTISTVFKQNMAVLFSMYVKEIYLADPEQTAIESVLSSVIEHNDLSKFENLATMSIGDDLISEVKFPRSPNLSARDIYEKMVKFGTVMQIIGIYLAELLYVTGSHPTKTPKPRAEKAEKPEKIKKIAKTPAVKKVERLKPVDEHGQSFSKVVIKPEYFHAAILSSLPQTNMEIKAKYLDIQFDINHNIMDRYNTYIDSIKKPRASKAPKIDPVIVSADIEGVPEAES